MRRRLVLSTLVVVLVVVAILGLPLAVLGARAIETNARARLAADADRVASAVDAQLEAGEGVDSERISRLVPGERFVVVLLPGADPVLLGAAPRGDVISARVEGPSGEVVTVYDSRADVADGQRRTYGLIGAAAVLAVGAAVGLAMLQARRLAEPLVELAETAERLGSGDARPLNRRYSVPELDRVAEVLDRSAERISRLLAAERQFAADASHQIRTPLTALSMRLEEIAATDDLDAVREEAAIALAQVERLAEVVERLLVAGPRAPGSGTEPVDVDVILAQQVEEWRPVLARVGRAIRREGAPGLRAWATPGGLAMVVGTLVENSLAHGAGTVWLRTRTTAQSVVVEVSDEGPGVPAELGPRVFERSVSGRASTGLGLTVARQLAESDGGRLELVRRQPPVFALFLASAEDAEPVTGSAPSISGKTKRR